MVTEAICFHSQQAVEKFIKAFLITKNVDFERTHNLEFLLEMCINQDGEFREIELGNLSFYAVEIRYPDEFHIPSVEEAETCLELARNVKNFIFKKLEIGIEDLKY